MKCFSDRINADWHTPTVLEELLIEFFDDEVIPKTITHLRAWLNNDWFDLEQKKNKHPKMRKLLETAELMCEEWVVNHGFENDKSFARWYLDRYHNKEDQTTNSDVTWIYELDE